MVIFHCYVSSPEGIGFHTPNIPPSFNPCPKIYSSSTTWLRRIVPAGSTNSLNRARFIHCMRLILGGDGIVASCCILMIYSTQLTQNCNSPWRHGFLPGGSLRSDIVPSSICTTASMRRRGFVGTVLGRCFDCWKWLPCGAPNDS